VNDKDSEASSDALIDEDSRLILSFVVADKDDSSPLHFVSAQLLEKLRLYSLAARENAQFMVGLCDLIDHLFRDRPEATADELMLAAKAAAAMPPSTTNN
jgi:hypothetical protein